MLPVQEAVNSSVCSMSIDAIQSVNTSSMLKIRLSQDLILYSGSEYDQSCKDPETWESEEESPPHQGKLEHYFQNKKNSIMPGTNGFVAFLALWECLLHNTRK